MEAKLAALEEEINILKGEIKSILQEVRTAVLAAENPFTGGLAMRQAAAALEDKDAEPKVVRLQAPPAAPAAASAEPQVPAPRQRMDAGATAETESFDDDPAGYETAPPAYREASGRPRASDPSGAPSHLARAPRQENREQLAERRPSAPDVRALAALLTWVEETRERLDERRYRVVLNLARYGDLIDPELEKTLLDAAETLGGMQDQEHASVNDCIVALRQIEAILAPDANVRRLSDYGLNADESGRSHREVRPSRRQ